MLTSRSQSWPVVALVVLASACDRSDREFQDGLSGPGGGSASAAESTGEASTGSMDDTEPDEDSSPAVDPADVPGDCGDGFTDPADEECDDGDVDSTDACVACKVARCGDGFVHVDVEECDDGDDDDADACTNDCELAVCGDAVVRTGVEECDDGNLDDSDACVSGCVAAKCGDGFVRPGLEACDDGNDVDEDACLATCEAAACGDGFVQLGVEACDGSEFGEQSCDALGQPGGALACTDDCALDTAGCLCGVSQPPIDGDYPTVCNGGCWDSTCVIDCVGSSACVGGALACPSGWNCRVDCDGDQACRDASVACAQHACEVECAGTLGCWNLTTTCGAGVCAVHCTDGGGVCEGLALVCGPNDGQVVCDSPQGETLTTFAGSQCGCTATGC